MGLFKYIAFILVSFVSIILFSCNNSDSIVQEVDEDEDTSEYQGEYLGQAPPGAQVREFVRGVFTEFDHLHSCPVFSLDGNLMLWSVISDGSFETWFMERENNQWSAPAKAQFINEGNADSPIFSPDGNRIFFQSSKPTEIDKIEGSENIWYVERTDNGWSEPILLGEEVNSYYMHWQISIANNGNLYFSGGDHSISPDIIKAEFINGEYTNVTELEDSINTDSYEDNPFIDPDEQYIIFSRTESTGYADLYISYKNTDGSWTEAINMGNTINTVTHELCANVTRDGEYLFFMSPRRGEGEIYWIDADIIEDLKPEGLK